MMCDSRLFGPQIMALGNSRAVHLPPITGHETVEAMATEILENAPKTFALAGLSMGGIVAMEVFRQAPLRVTRMCLMDTNALPETPAVAAAREPQIVKVMAGQLESVMADEMKPNYLAPNEGRKAVLDLVLDMALNLGEGVFLRQSRALQRRPDQQSTIRRLRIPTLIMCGEFDTLCPVSRHQFMADLVGHAKLNVIAGAGHLPTLEQPQAVNAAMQSWLAA
jgi:pimeloyl-ACP methyl ester carboxylesterase